MIIINPKVDKKLFIFQWEKIEPKPDEKMHDPNAYSRLIKHKELNLAYRIVQLEEADLDKVILPFHQHGYIQISQSGKSISEFQKKYSDQVLSNYSNDDCIKRLKFLMNDFERQRDQEFVEGRFMYISNNPDFGVPGHYNLKGLYTGSFHQFAAYEIWISKYKFIPLRLFYITE